eukprot:gene53936-32875_t
MTTSEANITFDETALFDRLLAAGRMPWWVGPKKTAGQGRGAAARATAGDLPTP